MNKDQVAGRLREAQGKVQEVTGKLVGNEKLQNTGRARKTSGHVQAGYGDLKQNLKKAV